jgi:predicted phage terminase large subunit-like protein
MEEVLDYKNLAPMHRELSESLLRAEKLHRGLYLLPRGHLKSTEITISYPIQRILKDPNIRILITNALLDNSKAFLREIKSHFEKNEKLKALYGEYQNTDEKWSESQIIVKKRTSFSKEPTIQITSVDKSVVSQHYDLIIADDLVTRDSIATKEQRNKLVKYYKDLLDLLEPGGTLLVIGTRWHYDDLYGWLLRQTGEREVIVRKILDEQGNPIFPQKFTQEYITSLKAEKGSYEFNAQYNNDPIAEEEADFKRSSFKYHTRSPEDGSIYITIDPAATTKDTADYTGIVVNCVRNGVWNILEAYHIRLNPTEMVDEIFYLYDKYKGRLRTMGIEDMMFTQALDYDITRKMQETGKWFNVEKVRHKGRNKEARIRALIPLFERGNISLNDRSQELEEELMRFPAGEHDDILDALAYQLDIVKAGEHFHQDSSKKAMNEIILPVFSKY